MAPPLGPLEESYLNRTNRALLYAAAGSTALALVLGIILAQTLTKREVVKVTEARLTYVAIDADGKPRPIPRR